MRRRLVSTATIWALLAAMLGGCAQDATPNSAASTITYWANPLIAPDQHAARMSSLLAEFTRESGIEVKLEMQDWTKVYPKIISGIASGSMPDIFDIGTTWVPALQATGGLMPIGDKAFAELDGRDRFLATSLAATRGSGRVSAAVPLVGQAYALFYNPALFAAAGIAQPPSTWDEFVAAARTLTRGDQYGFAFGAGAGLTNVHLAFILGRQNGAHLFSESGAAQFDSPQQRAAVGRLLNLMAVDKVIDPAMTEKDNTQALAEFAAGRAAMAFGQSSAISYLQSLKFRDYAVAPLPVLEPTPPGGSAIRAMVGGTNLAISATSKHKEAALALAAFLTSDSSQRRLNEAFGTLPVVKSLRDDKAFSSPTIRVFADALANHAEPMPLVPEEGAMEQVLGEALVSLWPKAVNGSLTDAAIGDALTESQDRMPAK